MAILYVRSTDGNDSDNGSTWALAKATVAGALAAASAGDRIWVSQAHAETQASAMTWTSPGTAASTVEILCGNDGAEPPTAMATSATVTTTGGSSISFTGYMIVYGIVFTCGSGSSSAAAMLFCATATTAGRQFFESCGFNTATTSNSANARSTLGTASTGLTNQEIEWRDCTVTFGHSNQGLVGPRSRFVMRGGSIAASGAVPAAVMIPSTGSQATARLIGVDLSAVNTALVDVSAGQAQIGFEQCKLHGSVALATGTNPGPGGPIVLMDNCDSGDTNYRFQRTRYRGDVYSETTHVRTGGASDGTTPLAHKLVTGAATGFWRPLSGPEIVQWNELTGSAKTVTVEILHDSATALTNADVWLEVEYLGTSGVPKSSFASDRAASVVATPADQTSSAATWNTTGLSNPNTQKLEVTVTPQEKGWLRARVLLAKASYTIYADPLLTVS